MNRQIMNLDNRHGWLADGITGMAGCVLHSIVGFVLLGCLPRSPIPNKSVTGSISALFIHYTHIYIGYSSTMLPFVITKALGDGNPILFTEVGESLTKEKDIAAIYVREKPAKLYEQILNTFLTDKSLYAIDACRGSGSCGVACQSLGVKCLVLEKSQMKERLIRQRIG